MKLTTVIHSLRPNTEWTISGDDYENIIWHTKGVKPLTQTEVENETIRLQEIEAQKETQDAEKRSFALAKLAALGLTTEDLKALGFTS
jgi:hypothetical protein